MCVKTKICLLFVFFRHGLHGKHGFTDFLYSFSVKSVSKRNRQVYFDTSPFKIRMLSMSG